MIRTVNHELVHLHEVHVIVHEVNFMAEFVVFRSKEDTDYTFDVFVAIHGDVISERFVVQPVLSSFDHGALGFCVTLNRHSIVQQGFKMIKISDEFVHGHGFDAYTWEI